MKKTLLLTMIVLLSIQTYAAKSKAKSKQDSRIVVCQQLTEQAEKNCSEYLCEEQVSSDEQDECYRDGDFYEAQQICVSEGELSELIQSYNKSTGKNLNCDDL